MNEQLQQFKNTLDEIKDLIDHIDLINKEICMWRKKFIESQEFPFDEETKARIKWSFYYIPSEEIVKESPEKILKQAIEFHTK